MCKGESLHLIAAQCGLVMLWFQRVKAPYWILLVNEGLNKFISVHFKTDFSVSLRIEAKAHSTPASYKTIHCHNNKYRKKKPKKQKTKQRARI